MNEITFSDVLIRPQYSEIESRKNVNTKTELADVELDLPIVTSNMKHVIGPDMAEEIYNEGGMPILHRFQSVEDNVDEFKECTKRGLKNVGVSIGVKDPDCLKRYSALNLVGANIFCIDIAHGHHILMKNTIDRIKNLNPQCKIIAGNIATPEAAMDLWQWGADVIKVGIGPGSVCTTRINTGVGMPQLYALKSIKEAFNIAKSKDFNPPTIIADGGIRYIGDIPKALKYADAVMVGSMLAGHCEVPSRFDQRWNSDQQRLEWYTIYGGSSGSWNKDNDKDGKFSEGMVKEIPIKGKVKFTLRAINDGLRSAFSYVGASNLKEFQEKCELVTMSIGGMWESKH